MKRKNICLALILALMFMFSISVSAEDGYTPIVNSYTNSTSDGARTVMIYKGTATSDITSENIYYINQCDEEGGFSNLEMLMKLDVPAGTYTVMIDGETKTTFEISDADSFLSNATEMTFLDAKRINGSSDSVAFFGFNAKALLSDASGIAMIIGDKAYKTDMFGENSIINWGSGFVYTEDGNLMFAIQLNGIGAEYITEEEGTLTPNFRLFFK